MGSVLRICSILSAALLVLGSARLEAQGRREIPERDWPLDRVVSRFEAGVRQNATGNFGAQIVMGILNLPDSHLARKDTLLDALEHIALTSSDRNVAAAAARWIAFAGEGGRAGPPIHSAFPRLLRIYQNNPAWSVRALVLDRLPMQAERRPAAEFLRQIAAEPDSSGGTGPHGYFSHGDLRLKALARLAEMGKEGRAVLQAMHHSGEARSPQARIVLEEMSRRGFPVRDLARTSPRRGMPER